MIQSVIIDVGCDIVSCSLDLRTAVAHSDIVCAQLKHGKIDLSVSKRDRIFLVGMQVIKKHFDRMFLGDACRPEITEQREFTFAAPCVGDQMREFLFGIKMILIAAQDEADRIDIIAVEILSLQMDETVDLPAG